jgi:hypothetical protein
MPTSTFDLTTLALVYVLPIDAVSLILTNVTDETVHTLTFGGAESDSTVDIPAVRQQNGFGINELVCYRLNATLYFPFNDLDDTTFRGALTTIGGVPNDFTLDSITLGFAHYGELGELSITISNGGSSFVEHVGCVAELEPHPERGLRLKLSLEGIFDLSSLAASST